MVRTQWLDRVFVAPLDRPERRNAIDHATALALVDAQREATEGGARVFVITGTTPAFCAGADLTGVESGEFVRALVAALSGFTTMGIVTMAAIDGAALGAGSQLVVACDLRVATERSVFGIPAAKLGLALDRWTITRMTRELSWPVARAMLLASETYTTERLLPTGAIHRVGDLDAALAWADEIAAMAPLTIAAHKLALETSGVPGDGGDPFDAAREGVWASADAEEGRTAFLEKRPPRFIGR